MNKTSRISNVEWGLFLLVLGLVDFFQFFIEWIAIAFSLGTMLIVTSMINFYIDLAVAFLLPLSLRLRGQKVTKPGQLGGLIGTFLLEMIPGIDELPLWTLDGVYYMVTIKAEYYKEDLLEKVPLGTVVEAKLNKLDAAADTKRAAATAAKVEQGKSEKGGGNENKNSQQKNNSPQQETTAPQTATSQQNNPKTQDTEKRRIPNVTSSEEFTRRRNVYNRNLEEKAERNQTNIDTQGNIDEEGLVENQDIAA